MAKKKEVTEPVVAPVVEPAVAPVELKVEDTVVAEVSAPIEVAELPKVVKPTKKAVIFSGNTVTRGKTTFVFG